VRYDPSAPQNLADWHLQEHDEAALFMGCGLGKTATVLHRLSEMFDDGACRGALVVAPLRVANLTWPAEVAKWDKTRHLRVANMRTKEGVEAFRRGSAELYVTNYERLPHLRELLMSMREKAPVDTVVWDELTKAKNHNSTRVNGVRKWVRKVCKRHWGLTGTPAPNSLLELFAQVRLLDGGKRLGPEFTAHRDAFFEPADWNQYHWVPQEGARERIYRQIGDMALTLKSSEWLDIPDVVVEDVELALPREAQGQYDDMEKELIIYLDSRAGGDPTAIVANNAAVLVGKLLQITSGAVYDEQKRAHHVHDAKLEALGELLKRIGREQVLLLYQYEHELERIRRAFPHVVAFRDAKTHRQQEVLVDQWNAGVVGVLAAHPNSLAHGLNMQEGGSTVVWFTLPWSPEAYEQAYRRVARRGQDAVTRIYRLLARGTMDDVVAEALRSKDDEQTALLDALHVWRTQLAA
jgi:SNF2 family DNA or RNA helicase